MKQVLIIDASPMFREFLTEKLTEENVKVETASLKRDAFTKLSAYWLNSTINSIFRTMKKPNQL